MSLFKKRKHEEMMKMIETIVPTSKVALKQQCILASQGDVEKAERLYNFYIKDLEDLPMFDPVQPTAMENFKTTASGIFSFIKNNREELMQGATLIRGIFSKDGLPIVPPAVTESLPPIN